MKYLIKNQYWELNKEYDIDKILYLLIDRPSEVISHINNINNSFITFIWENNIKQFHREYDLSAYITDNNYITWYKKHKLHRKTNVFLLIRTVQNNII